MAAQAEEPFATAADPSPPVAPLLRRASPDDDREEEKGLRDTKRRRTCVAALESLETEKEDKLDSFSFEARSIAPIEITPKFGSFNPVLSMETTIVESAPPSPPPEVSDGSPAEAGSGAEAEGEEGGDASHSKNGHSEGLECSETQ